MQNTNRETKSLQQVLTVSQFTEQIRGTLETKFDNVFVAGEVSNAKQYPSGHWYFSLKDKDATLPCVCFKSASWNLKFKLEDGLMVMARGRLTVYPPKGAYQLQVERLKPVGIGEWQLAFEQLREKLEKEGLLHPGRKRSIPILPRKIGIVTSPAGAAIRDILSALSRRNKSVSALISPARVQGEGSAQEIADAIELLQFFPDVEVILVARGGGSIEDLWAFNTEIVARAVANSRVPVISGVGHETDVTICDLVADMRAPTPTAAAEMVARRSSELLDRWKHLSKRLESRTQQRVTASRLQLDRADPMHSLKRYKDRLHHLKARLIHQRQSMHSRVEGLLARSEHRWRQNTEKMLVLGPQKVLARGFSILRTIDASSGGAIITSWREVQPGSTVEALLSSGRLTLKVESCHETWQEKDVSHE